MSKKSRMKKIAIIFCSVFVVLVIIISISYFSNAKKLLRNEVKKDLKGIVKIKAGQIVNWYTDEMGDAALITRNQILIEKINEFSESGNSIHKRKLIQFFETLQKEHGYANISLYSIDNQLLFKTNNTPDNAENIVKQTVDIVSKTKKLASTGIYKSRYDQNVYMSIISPVYNIGSDEAITLICFSIDINKQLYPTIMSSPFPWKSFETILLYQKNDTIVYLNHLISNSSTSSGINTEANIKFEDSISTGALTGLEGIIEGMDYRGNEVISFVCPLKGTDWFLVAKINSGEIEGSMRGEVTLLIIITILLSLLSIAAVAYLYNYRQKGLYKELYLKRQEFRATLYSIGDAVITTDKKGLIILMNNIAEQLTGWKETEARGKHLDKVFVIINEYTGKTVESPVNKVINTGAIVGLANHTLLVSKHSEEIPIADSGAPIKDENGDISGVVLVFRDQTEQRLHQKLLEASEAKYRELIESTDAIAWEYNIEKDQWTYVAPQVTDKLGWLPEEWVNLEFWKNNIHPDERELSANYCFACTAKGEAHTLEYRFRSKDGSYVWLRDIVTVEPKNNKPYKLRGVMLDISELKDTELQLREREYFLSESQRIAQIGSYFFDIVNNTWTASPVLNNLFGIGNNYEKNLVSWNEIVHPDYKDEMLNYFVNTVVKDRNPFFKEYKIKRINDGLERWVLGNGQLEYDDHGNALSMIGTIQDITERKEFEFALQKSNRHWQTLTEATRTLNSEMELKQILRYLVTSAMQLTGAQEGTAGLLVEGEMVFKEYNNKGNLVPIDYSFIEGYGVPGHVLKTRKPYLSNNTVKDEHVIPDIQKKLGFYNLIDTPIINRQGKVIGCFELHNKPGGFDDYDIMLLQNLASGTAIAIENAQIIEQLKKTKENLISTESNLLSLINNRKESIWSMDKKYQMIVCNDFFKDSYRAAYNFDLKMGVNLIELLTPELKEFWKPKYDTALGGERLLFEFSETILDEKFYFNVSLNPIIVGDEIKGVSALSVDITEKIKSERELKKSEEKFRKLFENHSAVHLLIDPDTGRIENANQAATDFYGWSVDELKNMRIHDINTLGHDEIEKRIEMARKSNNLFFEFKHRTANRNIRDVEVFSSMVELFGKEFLHSIVHDVSEKKESEKKLKLLAHSIEQSTVVVLITNLDGEIEYVNPAFTKDTGYTLEEVQGKNPNILKSGYQSREFYKHLWSTILSGINWEGELRNKKKNGELYWEKAIISPVIGRDGLITNYIAIKENITEKKRMIDELIEAKEKAEESDVLKSAFLANMSHEIRTPLNGILGFTGLLTREVLPPKHKRIEFGKIIEHCGQNLLHVISDILDISKLESGQLKINKTTFSLTKTLKTTFEIYQRKIGDNKKENIELKLKLPDDEILFESDENRLNQVFSNLIENAIKFTGTGEISFGISAIEPDKILFFVADTGIGIPQEKQEMIFDRFVQADPSIAVNYGGTGLGLSIVKKIIKILGGTLFLESEPGKGSVFYFSLPITIVKGISENSIANEGQVSYVKGKLKILLVEDDPVSCIYYQEILDVPNIELNISQNGKDALQLIKEKKPDIILMDIRLPDINGLELVKAIRRYDNKVYIIAQSAYAMSTDETESILAGCNDFISKPVKADLLFEKLKNVRRSG